MIVPALFASVRGPGMEALDAWFRGTSPVASGRAEALESRVSGMPRGEGRSPAVVVDLDSMARRGFTEGVMKNARVRGCDLWLMTWVQDADDLFDAFNGTADMVLGPYHAVSSKEDLEDIESVSDSFVPVVFVQNAVAFEMGGSRTDLRRALDRLDRIGMYKACVLDTDGSLGNSWDDLLDIYPSVMPFTRRPPSSGATPGTWIAPLPWTRSRR